MSERHRKRGREVKETEKKKNVCMKKKRKQGKQERYEEG
jgi:hypothetical protein